MTQPSRRTFFDAPATYQICVYGCLDAESSSILADTAIIAQQTRDKGMTTTLTATLADQAGLLGVLNELYDMGYTLLEARRLSELLSVTSDAASVGPAQP
jgi:hypothetical protein